jgi:exodeoxyribonuclease V alpha subunit
MQKTVTGVVDRVFFVNYDRPMMAGILSTPEGSIRFQGSVAADVGDSVELVGDYGPTDYGERFIVEKGQLKIDQSIEGLEYMLAKRKEFKGIGPVRALSIVNALRELEGLDDPFSLLALHSVKVAHLSGVPREMIEKIGELCIEHRARYESIAVLCQQGWTDAQAQAIIHRFGENAGAMVARDPYQLIGRVPRFGFKTVDQVALKMGINPTDPLRLQSGVAFCFDHFGRDGHTWVTRPELVSLAMSELRPDTLDAETKIVESIDDLVRQGVAVEFDLGGDVLAICDARVARAEISVFKNLMAGLAQPVSEGMSYADPEVRDLYLQLNEGQRAALLGLTGRRFGVVTGGAGVGKTFTMRAVTRLFETNGKTVMLAAPTGKAARKLSHSTDRHAQTIHRLLESRYDRTSGAFSFARNNSNPIDADLIVLDEFSMVPIDLMARFLDAVASSCRLLLVGDHHQIPSVGAGAILRDVLLMRGRFSDSIHALSKVVRQAGELERNTSKLIDGELIGLNSRAWEIVRTEDGQEGGAANVVAKLVEQLVINPSPIDGQEIDIAWDVQVLSPMKKGPMGTHTLNVQLQALRHRLMGSPPPKPPVKPDMPPLPLPGDRVIWVENDYELDLFNGTQAIYVEKLKKGGALLFTEDGREVEVPEKKVKLFQVGYALTIHKSQGSEWPYVVLVAGSPHHVMHDRNLLYTGASRASKMLRLVGDIRGMKRFAREQRSSVRRTLGRAICMGWTPPDLAVEKL